MSGRPCRTTWFGWAAIALAMACWSGDDADTLAPGVPTLVTAVPGAGSVALWWQDPTDTDLAGIRLTYEPGGGALDVAPGAGTASFDGLVDGTEYTFLLVARDVAGHESPGIAVRAIPGNVIGRTAPRRLHVVVALTIANTGQDLTQMSIVFPYVPRNPYQDVGAIALLPGGEVLDVPDSENRYVRYLVTGSDLPLAGETRTWSYEFDVTLYTVVADLAAVTGPYDYDTTTELYARYTGDSGVWVVPGHPTIRSVSDTLWGESTDLPDYVRRCYDYVATSFTYAAPHGHESLDDILAAGTGDCGCLSAVFVSLLHSGPPPRVAHAGLGPRLGRLLPRALRLDPGRCDVPHARGGHLREAHLRGRDPLLRPGPRGHGVGGEHERAGRPAVRLPLVLDARRRRHDRADVLDHVHRVALTSSAVVSCISP